PHGCQEPQQLVQPGEFLLVNQQIGVFHLGQHLVGVGDEVRRDIATIELHPLDHIQLGLERLRLLHGDHTLVADLLHGIGDEAANLRIPVSGRVSANWKNPRRTMGSKRREMSGRREAREEGTQTVATCAISSFGVTAFDFFLRSPTTASTAVSTPRFRSIGFMPAATALAPSLTMAWASTVAVVVPSPAWSEVLDATSLTIWAPMFSNLSSSSISLATVTPSLLMRGAPKDFSSTTLRPLGPSVTRTALERISMPRSILSRASPENLTSLAAISLPPVASPVRETGDGLLLI